MGDILTEAQLRSALGSGGQPGQIAMDNLIRTLFSRITGSVAADSAAAGEVGEYLSASVLVGAAVALVTNTPKTVVPLDLTPGDWQVNGTLVYVPAASTSITFLSQGISSTTDAINSAIAANAAAMAAVVPGATNVPIGNTPPVRVNISVAATYYLVSNAVFTVSTLSAYGIIRARRMR